MKYKIEDIEKVIANAKLLNHTHIKLNPFEKEIYSGFRVKDGWMWFEMEILKQLI